MENVNREQSTEKEQRLKTDIEEFYKDQNKKAHALWAQVEGLYPDLCAEINRLCEMFDDGAKVSYSGNFDLTGDSFESEITHTKWGELSIEPQEYLKKRIEELTKEIPSEVLKEYNKRDLK